MAENVLDFILRARNTQEVTAAFQQVVDAMKGVQPAAQQAGTALDDTGDKAAQTGKQVEEAVPQGFSSRILEGAASLGKLTAAFGLAQLGVAGFQQVLGRLSRAIREGIIGGAAEAELALKRFNFALEASGQFSRATSQELQTFATRLAQATGTSDEQILSTMQRLLQLGKVSVDQLARVTTAVLDVSAATGRAQEDVARMLAILAESGEARGLKQLGLTINETLDPAGRLVDVLEQIERKMGGTAVEAAQTYIGSMAKLKEAMGELGETIGQRLVTRLERYITTLSQAAVATNEFLQRQTGVKQLSLEGSIGQLARLQDEANAANFALNELIEGRGRVRAVNLADAIAAATDAATTSTQKLNAALVVVNENIRTLQAEAGNVKMADAVAQQVADIRRLIALVGADLAPEIKEKIEEGLKRVEMTMTATVDADTTAARAQIDKLAADTSKKKLKVDLEIAGGIFAQIAELFEEAQKDAERASKFMLDLMQRRGDQPADIVNLEELLRTLPPLETILRLQEALAKGGDKWVESLSPKEAFEEWKRLNALLTDIREGKVSWTGDLTEFEKTEAELRAKLEENRTFFEGQPLVLDVEAAIREQDFALARRLIEELQRLAHAGANLELDIQVNALGDAVDEAEATAKRGGKKIAKTMEEQLGASVFGNLQRGFNTVLSGMLFTAAGFANKTDSLMKTLVQSVLAEFAKLAVSGLFRLIGLLVGGPVGAFIGALGGATGKLTAPTPEPTSKPGAAKPVPVDVTPATRALDDVARQIADVVARLNVVPPAQKLRIETDATGASLTARAVAGEIRDALDSLRPADVDPSRLASTLADLGRAIARGAPEIEIAPPDVDVAPVVEISPARPVVNVRPVVVESARVATAIADLRRAVARTPVVVRVPVDASGIVDDLASTLRTQRALFSTLPIPSSASIVAERAVRAENVTQLNANFSQILDGADFERYMRTRGLRALSALMTAGR